MEVGDRVGGGAGRSAVQATATIWVGLRLWPASQPPMRGCGRVWGGLGGGDRPASPVEAL